MKPFSITFTVPGAAIPKARARVVKVKGRTMAFTPEKTVNFESLVSWTAKQAMEGKDMWMGPVKATIEVILPIPTSWSGKRKMEAAADHIAPTKKPDADNIQKALFDAMNEIVFKDDSQVVDIHCWKRYGLTPETRIRIESTCQEAAK